MNMQQVKIFDTTLRDGQQCPGAAMSLEKNIEYAQLAKAVNIDILEAGFPSASKLDFKIVQEIAQLYKNDSSSPIVAALCQLREAQIDTTIQALDCLIKEKKARLHVYLPVDPHLMAASLGEKHDKEKILTELFYLIKKAATAGLEVEFSPEGYSRMAENFDFTTDVIRAAISAGATIINCPDTIGGACKWEGEEYFVEKMQRHATIMQNEFPDTIITWSAHCHNDFGLALDNTMNAVFNGPARQIEGCFNGIGERAGNVSLEQCIMYIKYFGHNKINPTAFYTQAKTEYIQKISDFVAENMLARQAHSPISGENAARHTSGGHTNAIIKNPRVYQPFDPNEVGNNLSFVFGPLSGGNHAKSIIEQHGYECSDAEKQQIGQYIKDFYEDRRKGITNEELIQAYFTYRAPIKLDHVNYSRTDDITEIQFYGKFFEETELTIHYQGQGSALTALNLAITEKLAGINIQTYYSDAESDGITALSRSTIVITRDGHQFSGVGHDHDIEISALRALIDAANQSYIYEHHRIIGA